MSQQGPSAKQKNAGETDKDESSGDGDDDDLTQHLLQWKLKLNQKF
jgi:RNA polymerase primary sigma factor